MATEERIHSPIGASQCERFWNCPGSVKLIQTLPDKGKGTTSIHAATGTAKHSFSETALKNRKLGGMSAVEIKPGLSCIVDGHRIEITEEFIDHVRFYVDFVLEELKESGPYAQLFLEHEFRLTDIDEDAWGSADAVILQEFGKLKVIDAKFGYRKVWAQENKQLQYYALGAAQLGDFNEVELIIVQPACENPEERVSRWTTFPWELESFSN